MKRSMPLRRMGGPCHEHTHAHPAESYATGRLARRGVQ